MQNPVKTTNTVEDFFSVTSSYIPQLNDHCSDHIVLLANAENTKAILNTEFAVGQLAEIFIASDKDAQQNPSDFIQEMRPEEINSYEQKHQMLIAKTTPQRGGSVRS